MHANLHRAFLDELSEARDAATIAANILLSLSQAVNSQVVRDQMNHYLEQTREHAHRLEELARAEADIAEGARESAQLRGLQRTADALIERYDDQTTREAVLVALAQKLAHSQIATYGTLCVWAKTLEKKEAVQPLKACLSEAKGADEALSNIARESVNRDAL